MSSGHSYKAVGWNRQKKLYDGVLWLGVVGYVGVFIGVGAAIRPNVTIETLLIRAFGTGALFLLHIVLSIGPLCRLDERFLPLLYNRRHLGVSMFILALAHGALSLFQFHALGNINPLVSVFVSNGRYDAMAQFPFQPLGVGALVILFLMAATSHDFWLANLTPPVWKGLHMAVYAAYALIVMHVALGILQVEPSPALAALMGAGLIWILALHLAAARREQRLDRPSSALEVGEDFVPVCSVAEIPDHRARVVMAAGERVAIFKYDGKIAAVSNVCQHQNGPLGEGRIIDGCITCPWHGYQYEPETGSSPPPFNERVPTFDVRVEGERVLLRPQPNRAGTRVEPALIPKAESSP